eukprot:SAG31_NODE_1483_length_8166_cov_5.059874_2_plen_169_part_00
MLIVSTSYLIFMLIDQEIHQYECVIFVLLYFVYVAMVVLGSRVPPLKDSDRPEWEERQRERRRKSRKNFSAMSASDDKESSLLENSAEKRDGNVFLPNVGEIDVNASAFTTKDVPQDSRPWGRNYENETSNGTIQLETPQGTGWALDASALEQLDEAQMNTGASNFLV